MDRIYTRQQKLRILGYTILMFALIYILARLAGLGWEMAAWW